MLGVGAGYILPNNGMVDLETLAAGVYVYNGSTGLINGPSISANSSICVIVFDIQSSWFPIKKAEIIFASNAQEIWFGLKTTTLDWVKLK